MIYLSTFSKRGALLHTLYHPEKVEDAPLKRALARKEVAKVSTPRENPRGDLIPPFLRDCELSSRPPPRQARRRSGTFIYRSGNRAESTPSVL